MIQRITRDLAQRLFDAMGQEVTLPVTPDYDWFAFYGGQYFPRNVVFSHYTTNDDGLMGVIARVHVELPKRERPPEEANVKQLPLPKKPPTFKQPTRYCLNCKRVLPQGHKYQTCSFKCHQEHQAMLDKVEAEDKQAHEHPF